MRDVVDVIVVNRRVPTKFGETIAAQKTRLNEVLDVHKDEYTREYLENRGWLVVDKNFGDNVLIVERADAKKAKNFARADEIRNQLTEAGIVLEDGAGGTTWRRG